MLSAYLQSGNGCEDAVAGGVTAVQTFGDFRNSNPHLHIIASDGCFYGNGGFVVGPRPRAFRRSWARLIQKVYQVDPLVCPKCRGEMRIISFIEDSGVVEKSLRHLGLWKTRNRDPPAPDGPRNPEFTYDDDYSQVPPIDYYLK